jgi:hypothetical protein
MDDVRQRIEASALAEASRHLHLTAAVYNTVTAEGQRAGTGASGFGTSGETSCRGACWGGPRLLGRFDNADFPLRPVD